MNYPRNFTEPFLVCEANSDFDMEIIRFEKSELVQI